MLEIRTSGSIFDCGADAVVVPVNCMGVAGKGVALEAKRRWPNWFEAYRTTFAVGNFHAGDVWAWTPDMRAPGAPRSILSATTKQHWRSRSKFIDVDKCIVHIRQWAVAAKPRLVSIPALGCGLGGLDWDDVLADAVDVLSPECDTTFLLFAPKKGP